jgi:hypothetical protein
MRERSPTLARPQVGKYDIIIDHDLTATPASLRRYQVLLINGHSEYWSVPAYGVHRFCATVVAVVLSARCPRR